MKKKIVMTVFFLFCLVWCVRIIQVNQNTEMITEYRMNEWFAMGNWNIQVAEACLYDRDEFYSRFGIDSDNYHANPEWDYRMLCVRLLVENDQKAVPVAEIYNDVSSYGFETAGWAAIGSPGLFTKVNDVHSEELLEANHSLEVWCPVEVNDICFRKKTWEKLSEKMFYMTPSLRPEKIRVLLELGNKKEEPL